MNTDYLKETQKEYDFNLAKAKEHSAIAEKHKQLAFALENVLRLSNGTVTIDIKPVSGKPEIKIKKTRKRKKKSFEDIIIEFMGDGIPKTTGDIVGHLEEKTGKRKKSSNVSSQLNSLLKYKKSIQFMFLSKGIKLWGLPYMFSNGELKSEILDLYKKNKGVEFSTPLINLGA